MKKGREILFLMLLMLCFSACSKGSEQPEKRDDYVCVANTKMEAGRGEELAENGKSFYIIGSNGAYRVTNYLFELYADSETEVLRADSQGALSAFHWSFQEKGQVVGAGNAVGNEGFVTLHKILNQPETDYQLNTWDRNGALEQSISLDLQGLYGEAEPETVMIDSDRNIHLAGQPFCDDSTEYLILSPQGEKLWKREFKQERFWCLIAFPDGSVAVDIREKQGESKSRHQVIQIETKSGKETVLFEYVEENEKGWEAIRAVNRFDEEHWLLVTGEEIILCNNRGEERKSLYSVKEHGYKISDVLGVFRDEENISILIKNAQGAFYLRLVPAPEEIHITELAVPKGGGWAYNAAVAEFNLRHPDRQIVIRDDYDRTQLLTKLIAGDGPALIDTQLVSLTEQRDYWEPLNETFECLGLTEDLNEAAMKLGSVDEAIYGIVVDFYITTLISASEQENWDYDSFLQCVEEGQTKYIVDNAMGESKSTIACMFLDGGVEDSLYLDKTSVNSRVRTEELRRAAILIDKYGPEQNPVPYVEGVEEGEVLCNLVYILNPSDLPFYHKIYGDKAKIKGFPRKNGAKNLITGSHVMVIRKAADSMDKEIAMEFAQMLLSKEMQTAMSEEDDFHLSIRKDVLKDQFFNMKENTWACPAGYYDWGMTLEDPDCAESYRECLEIISNSVPVYEGNDPYKMILDEEFEKYFSGEQSEEALVNHLENRIGLFLEEDF